jgi:hypothetical protein
MPPIIPPFPIIPPPPPIKKQTTTLSRDEVWFKTVEIMLTHDPHVFEAVDRADKVLRAFDHRFNLGDK